ncbi:restriction endonuclease subunit S [Methylibium sp.]|uniref:restriction endonuclease subunit S n=1 Tax=Methylibium sp. TaxID=2067992 RepID=UPI00286C295E|nr:restriction endonuclease subunit S [Methylibium sp.]
MLRLEECLDALIDYRGKTPEKTESGIPLVTAKIIKGGRIERPSEFIASEAYESWMRRGIPQAGDVVLTTEAPMGEVAQLGNERVALAQRVVTLRGKAGLLDSTFLLYVLQTEEMQEQLRSRATGTTVLGIKQSELRKISVSIPPIELQRNSASTLAAIDARIDLLRETSATLEAIAQALFKSWFVDFDPVRAKQQGLAPASMDEATAALFPDSFEESALGLVPKTWETAKLGAEASYLNRGISPKYVDVGGVLVINQKCVRDFKVDLRKARRHDDGQRGINGRELRVGDVLVNSTGVGTLGRVAQVLTLDEPTIVDSHVTVVRAGDRLSWNYLGLAMMRRQAEIEELGEGTTGQTELNRGKLAGLAFVVPPREVLEAFDASTLPLRMRLAANSHQAQTLATLRDTLLPRLISGQLRLPAAKALAD